MNNQTLLGKQRRRLLLLGGLGATFSLAGTARASSVQASTSSTDTFQLGVVNNESTPGDESTTNITTTTALVANTTSGSAFSLIQLGSAPVFQAVGGPSVIGSAAIPTRLEILTNDAPWRLQRWTTLDASGNRDNVCGFTYNIQFDQAGDNGYWLAPDVSSQPVYVMGFESHFNGNAEWNWDLRDAGTNAPQYRPFGAEYSYSTQYTGFSFGDVIGGGLSINGGSPIGQVLATSALGQVNPIVQLQRIDGSTLLKVHPAAASIVMSGSSVQDVNGAGWNGCFRLMDATLGFDIGGTATTDTALATRIDINYGPQDSQFRFLVQTDGTHRWGDGTNPQDTTLYRASAGTLKTDGSLLVGADLGHQGANLGFYGAAPAPRPSVTGSVGGNAALANLISQLALLGLIQNNTTS